MNVSTQTTGDWMCASKKDIEKKTEKPDEDERPVSPISPICAICARPCSFKCLTEACFHKFCFKCITELAKEKVECPICKISINRVVHVVCRLKELKPYFANLPFKILEGSEQRFTWYEYTIKVTPEKLRKNFQLSFVDYITQGIPRLPDSVHFFNIVFLNSNDTIISRISLERHFPRTSNRPPRRRKQSNPIRKLKKPCLNWNEENAVQYLPSTTSQGISFFNFSPDVSNPELETSNNIKYLERVSENVMRSMPRPCTTCGIPFCNTSPETPNPELASSNDIKHLETISGNDLSSVELPGPSTSRETSSPEIIPFFISYSEVRNPELESSNDIKHLETISGNDLSSVELPGSSTSRETSSPEILPFFISYSEVRNPELELSNVGDEPLNDDECQIVDVLKPRNERTHELIVLTSDDEISNIMSE